MLQTKVNECESDLFAERKERDQYHDGFANGLHELFVDSNVAYLNTSKPGLLA